MEIQSIAELRLFSKSKAAAILGIGKNCLNNLIDDGKLGVIRIDGIIKIPGYSIKQFIEKNLQFVKKTSNHNNKTNSVNNNGFDSRNFITQIIQEN